MDFKEAKKLYFIGIGGSSMSSLAEIMHGRGYEVAGSDCRSSYTTDHLQALGVTVFIGHDADHIRAFRPDIVVRTDAIMPDNPEWLYAEAEKITTVRRAFLLGFILDGYRAAIGVAGTHGKTTTSSMITSVMLASGLDFSAIIGGQMKQLNASYHVGKTDDVCVFESCEFRDSFLQFRPSVSVVTNIAEDHMEYFKTKENLLSSFRRYLDNTRGGGTVVMNAEDDNSLSAFADYTGKTVTFGMEKGDFTASDVTVENGRYAFTLKKRGVALGTVSLGVPGRHNIKNALAAAAACDAYGIDPATIVRGLSEYAGAKRRFEYHGTVNGAVIADDYGHHPDAYRVTFDAARDLGFKRIIAIHQPHTFTRTERLMDEFVDVLKTVDRVLIPPIYAARENPADYTVKAQDVVDRLPNAEFMPDFDAIADRVKALAQPGDLFITLGCGDIYLAAELTVKKYGDK